MGPSNNSKRRPHRADYVNKTLEDLLRYALKKKGIEEQIVPFNDAISQALMVWDDDGGAVGIT